MKEPLKIISGSEFLKWFHGTGFTSYVVTMNIDRVIGYLDTVNEMDQSFCQAVHGRF